MDTAKHTKLTFKQAALSLLLQAIYWLLSPLMRADDPRRLQIEGLLNEADMLSGDYANVIQRRASHLSKEDCLDVIAYLDELKDDDNQPAPEHEFSPYDLLDEEK
jgi:hypothetical protein